jgi:hypothetical protein
MWNRIKRWFSATRKSNKASTGEKQHQFKWYDPGPDNPFPVRILDVRSFTWNVVAMTSDAKIAATFSIQRNSDGREFIEKTIENARTIESHLVLPHNGDPLEGIVFKADSMDVKWDIYIYDSVFLFVRSWTGQLEYRALANVGPDKIMIHRIETSAEKIETAPQAVYFLLATHAMRYVLPHTIPRDTPQDAQQIALCSFAMYGNRGCYATFEDITTIPLNGPKPST